MKKIGLVTRFDEEIIDLRPEQIDYCKEINNLLRYFTVKNGKIAVQEHQIIYYYQDRNIFCSYTKDVWEKIEEYELRIHPQLWNVLSHGVEKIKLRYMGRNLVYHFVRLGDLPILHAYIPGRWLQLIQKYYKL